MTDAVVVLSTVAKAEDGERIARALVGRRIAACVNVVPGVLSTYRWKGTIEHEPERLLVIKTTSDRLAELKEALVELHPYDVPEVLALSVQDAHAAYLEWLRDSVRHEP